MRRESVEAVVRGLNEGGVRYRIAGGLAVAAHGCPRLTADVDLIVDPEETNLRKGVRALRDLGYRPRARARRARAGGGSGPTGRGGK